MVVRIVHTSDWHLGRNFGPVSLLEDQRAFCQWLTEWSIAEGIDLVIVAGDIYDRAIPPVEAIELFTSTVKALTEAGIVVAAITGNHDAADRVAPYLSLMESSRFYLRGGYRQIGEVIPLNFDDGPLDLALLPYLEPRSAPDDFGFNQDSADHHDTDYEANDANLALNTAEQDDTLVKRRLARTHAEVMRTSLKLIRSRLNAPRSVVVAHAFVTGGSASDSERQLVVGGTGEVPVELFEGFSYAALGHLHRPQNIGSTARVRYCGTPLAYSFSEEHEKSVSVINLNSDGTLEAEQVAVPVGRGVVTLSGEIDDLLTNQAYLHAEACFLRAIVTDRATVFNAKAKLAARFPHVIEVQLRPEGNLPNFAQHQPQFAQSTPLQVASEFWRNVEGEAPSISTLELLTSAVEAATSNEAR